MSLLDKKEFRTQLYFSDGNKFRFIKRQLEYSCLLEKKGEKLIRAWKHFFGNQLYFPGYKKISADTVTLAFARDIILDPFNKIPIGQSVSEKPKTKDTIGLKKWIALIAENQRHIYRSQRKSTFKEDFINWCLMGVLVLMTIVWLIAFARGMYS